MITLKDKLSHLTYTQACKLLGPKGKYLISAGGKYEIDIFDQVELNKDLFQLSLPEAVVKIYLDPGKTQKLNIQCSACNIACEHKGAALSLILEEKLVLGLSAPPPEKVPMESLSEKELVQRAIEERTERAQKEKMNLRSIAPNELWTDYIITNDPSGKSYRIALRGWQPGESFCSCPDFRKNTLGTCKHLIHTIEKVGKKFKNSIKEKPAKIQDISIYLKYGKTRELRMLIPDDIEPQIGNILIQPYKNKPVKNVRELLQTIRKVESLGSPITIYPDAEEYINMALYKERVHHKISDIRKNPEKHPLRKTLLKTELLPYQLDGIAFAVGAGRAILADDMGLGKTIQGIGVAELLSKDADISKVLVICPASLKSQWRIEVNRFSHRKCRLVLGTAGERHAQYDNPCFFTICNYEQVLRDIMAIEKVKWDLIILDEAQRIKNWEAKTSQTIKALKSQFALVLTGTPLENRIDELFSVVEFIDDRRLGPAFRFFNQHKVMNERGKLLGYKNLDKVRAKLAPILLRRTRRKVMKELPPRTTEILRIPPTDEQLNLHNEHKRTISTIISKKYLSEMDILRLQKALLMCRMIADSTFLADKQPPGFSSKLKELALLLDKLMDEEDRKIILFSEWTTMLNLIEPLLEDRKLNFVRLDGSVPQKKRQALMLQFQKDPHCKLFITTNAGSTGLNLQAANTVINIDLPWNPAILEQRISRAHRMGQKRPVQVFLLITEGTLEESLLTTLSAKQELSLAILDPDTQTTEVDMAAGIEELKRRMEILLGNKPAAPEDESLKEQVENETVTLARKEKMAAAGGQLLGAAFSFMGEMFGSEETSDQTRQIAKVFKNKLEKCMQKDENGNLTFSISLPDESFLDNMATSLARIVSRGT